MRINSTKTQEQCPKSATFLSEGGFVSTYVGSRQSDEEFKTGQGKIKSGRGIALAASFVVSLIAGTVSSDVAYAGMGATNGMNISSLLSYEVPETKEMLSFIKATKPVVGKDYMPVPQAILMTRKEQDLINCGELQSAYDASGLPRYSGDSFETLSAIEKLVKKRVSYKNDKGLDTWTNYAENIIEGKRFSGDCDDMVVTVTALAICAGVPAKNMNFAIVDDPLGSKTVTHLVGMVKSEDGNHYVYGDTFGKPGSFKKYANDLQSVANVEQDLESGRFWLK